MFYYFKKTLYPCHYIVWLLDWSRHVMHVWICSSFVYFWCCKYYMTLMSRYQWLIWCDGPDRQVWCKEECTDLPVLGLGLAMPRGLCTGEYEVGIFRWLRRTDDVTNQHNPWSHQHSLQRSPFLCLQCLSYKHKRYFCEQSYLIGLLTVCLFVCLILADCTFCK